MQKRKKVYLCNIIGHILNIVMNIYVAKILQPIFSVVVNNLHPSIPHLVQNQMRVSVMQRLTLTHLMECTTGLRQRLA